VRFQRAVPVRPTWRNPEDSECPKVEQRVKSWPSFFEATLAGVKTHDVRRMGDRDYQVGDTLLLMEFDPEKQQYTRRR
jgi:hypothetical protein